MVTQTNPYLMARVLTFFSWAMLPGPGVML